MEIPDLKDKYIAAYEKIVAADNILLVTHERPDGDALSSLGALSVFLDKLKKNQTLFCADQPPDFFSFLPNFNKIISNKNFQLESFPSSGGAAAPRGRGGSINFSAFDLIIVLDCGSITRTKLVEEIGSRKKNQFVIEFDHHPKIDDYTDLEIRAEKTSTAEVLYYFFSFNNLEIDKDIANCLLTGILTDTGNLLFGAVTPETIRIASSLLLHGATFPKITRRTVQNTSLAAVKAWAKILDNLKLNEKYNLAYSVLTYEEIQSLRQKYGNENLLDAATDILNNVDGVKAVIFLREEEPGKIRGSLRTKDARVDVSRLAAFLGGGGHPRAAAFRLPGHIIKTETGWKIE
ncbi:MAG TPA: bifunctional oligoribonuclease/PAP phosphatase NrnA [Candidatus Methylomirabilis sp.]|nr:bifunctional oligoribonuclease/PAP phosphatase NrnA [Candidatus Methylomirabilis sp.]